MSGLRASAIKYASGTIVSQALIIVATPVMTRLYAPAAFGELALITALYGILINFTTLKFELSILLPKLRDAAVESNALALCVCLVFCGLVTAVLLGWWEWRGLPWHYFLLPCALFAGAIFSLAQLWCSREKDFVHIGLGSLISAIANIGFCIGVYFVCQFPGALVAGYTLGLVAAALYLAGIKWDVWWKTAAKLQTMGFGRLRQLLIEGRTFPLHVLPNTLLTSLAYQLIPILMARFFDNSIVGLYSVANRLLYLPSILVAAAFADIFRSELMTRMHASGDALAFFRKSFGLLLLFTIPAYLALWLLSPFLFRVFLGANFSMAGIYARYLCAGVAANMLVTCFSYVFIAVRATKASLVLQIAGTAATIGGFLIGAVRGNIDQAMLYMSFFSALMAIPFLYVMHRKLVEFCIPAERTDAC